MGVLPEVTGDLGATIPEGGHLVSAYALGVVVGAPLLAVLGAKLQRTTLLLLLLVGVAVGNAASALAPGFGSLLVARFAAGLPHGAYFGIGAVVAAALAPPDRRARAVAFVMLGLTIANLLGVPVATWLGQELGWRTTYGFVAVVGLLAVAAVARYVPAVPAQEGATARQELGALRRRQVWLALLTGAIGFGGFFAVYSYISPTLTDVTGTSESVVPVILAVFGVGMTLGTLVGGRLADWSIPRTVLLGLGANAVLLVLFTWTAHALVPAAVTLLLFAATGSAMIPALQMRLMDVSPDAQSLAAALHHSALNVANALGAWLGGLVIALGWGYTAPAAVGAVLALLGIVVFAYSVRSDRVRQRARAVELAAA
ncbi:MFS transporter [Vallicoccus soli]|uniref:MFS transporter n=2 Tax=Vallicoccus soli TaxID=2339232 RepID=A0A3A3ZHU2_9ACTN|nr:MFS transporter [Vallicoccus soli]